MLNKINIYKPCKKNSLADKILTSSHRKKKIQVRNNESSQMPILSELFIKGLNGIWGGLVCKENELELTDRRKLEFFLRAGSGERRQTYTVCMGGASWVWVLMYGACIKSYGCNNLIIWSASHFPVQACMSASHYPVQSCLYVCKSG
jgi:hypothetical protein